jgi:hypothetical protein
LVPNLPPHAVIVLDNAPYHCIQVDKPPSAYALKSDMISWLHNNGVDCNATMCKDSLYTLTVPLNPKDKAFKIDRILSDYGYTVVWLPPYMCYLNPIELEWAKIVREHNVTADLSLQKLLQTVHDAIGQVNQEDCEGFCQHIVSGKTILGNGWYCSRCDRQHRYQPRY